MSDIEWKSGMVCFAMGMQWFNYGNSQLISEQHTLLPYDGICDIKDFQQNEIREGDFIPASELDTEQKYNEVVEVFGLFGFKFKQNDNYSLIRKSEMLTTRDGGALIYYMRSDDIVGNCKRKLTYSQIIAIGKLKRMMLEREVGKVNKEFNESEIESVLINADIYSAENLPKIDLEEKPKRRNKSKQAYGILKSLDYEYDLVRQRWYKKQYID